MGFVQVFAGTILFILWLLVLARMLISWFDPSGSGAVARFLFQATEPILAPVRKVLPPAGVMDLSGLLVLLVLGALWRVIL